MSTTIAQAWNGKWHIFDHNTRIRPAQPVSNYNRIAKPERQEALAGCGLRILVKETRDISHRSDFMGVTRGGFQRDNIRLCANCRERLTFMYPSSTEPVTWLRGS